jgi:hypothetical protein
MSAQQPSLMYPASAGSIPIVYAAYDSRRVASVLRHEHGPREGLWQLRRWEPAWTWSKRLVVRVPSYSAVTPFVHGAKPVSLSVMTMAALGCGFSRATPHVSNPA